MKRFFLLAVLVIAPTLAESAAPPRKAKPSILDQFFAKFDRNRNGSIERAELPEQMRQLLRRLDSNNDGKLSRAELADHEQRLARFVGDRPGKGGRPGEVITPAAKGERQKDLLKVGDVAPDFTLPDLSGKKTITLSSYKGKMPVVLILASYT